MPAFLFITMIAVAGWIFIEIRFPKPVWLRLAAGLGTMGLLVALTASALWMYCDYITGTHVYFLEAIRSDLREKPAAQVEQYLDIQIPQISQNRNLAAQMHRLLVERELSQLDVNKQKK